MTAYCAFLRAVNVGGTGMLPMKDLTELCEKLGFGNVRTYIQSGNVLFTSTLEEAVLTHKLARALEEKMGKKVSVITRTFKEVGMIVKKNPFAEMNPSQVGVMLYAEAVPKNEVGNIVVGSEQVTASQCELYVYFPEGMGKSKLKLPKSLTLGTTRNIRTLTNIAALLKEL